MNSSITRRGLLGAGAAALLPFASQAQGKTLVAATFPGTWNEAHRDYLAPAFTKRTGASVTQSILLGNDQLSRLMAAKGGRPPFDVALFDSPQVLDAAKQGLIAKYPTAKSPELQGPAARVPGRMGAAHLHADHRHRLQPAANQGRRRRAGTCCGTRNTRAVSA